MSSYYEKILATGEVKCIDEEIPFEIPQGWEWCRLGNVSSVYGGKRIPAGRKLSTSDTGHKYIRVSDMKNSSVLLDNIQYVSEDIYQLIKAYTISKDDLYITVAGTIGSVGEIPEELNNANLTENADKIVFTIIDKRFLMYALQSELVQSQIKECTTKVGQPKLAIMRIQGFLIALPPLNEQKRIVGAIEVVMPSVSKYEQAQIALEKLNTGLNEKIRKSVLQEAIQGKILPQDPNDEPTSILLQRIKEEKHRLVKEGKLKKKDVVDSVIYKGDDNKYYEQIGKQCKDITEEIPFEIPKNSSWCRLRDICSIFTGATFRKDEAKTDIQGVRILRGGNILPFEIIKKTDDLFLSPDQVKEGILLKKNDIITPAVTSLENIGKMARVGQDLPNVTVGGFVFVLRPHYSLEWLSKFLLLFMSSPSAIEYMKSITNKSGQAFYNIGKERLATTLIPIPPIEEEKRIADKVEGLFKNIKG